MRRNFERAHRNGWRVTRTFARTESASNENADQKWINWQKVKVKCLCTSARVSRRAIFEITFKFSAQLSTKIWIDFSSNWHFRNEKLTQFDVVDACNCLRSAKIHSCSAFRWRHWLISEEIRENADDDGLSTKMTMTKEEKKEKSTRKTKRKEREMSSNNEWTDVSDTKSENSESWFRFISEYDRPAYHRNADKVSVHAMA